VNDKQWLWTMSWLVFLVLSTTSARAGQTNGACISCHETLGGELSRPVVEWRGSVHFHNDITCDLCHGGDAGVAVGQALQLSGPEFAAKKAAAMAKGQGFVGRPSRRKMFDMCAQCHPDTVADYAASIMGKAYLDNRGGPSCVTCHQAHNNIIPAVPAICADCHQDTSGFSQIDPMNVTKATIDQLAAIRIRLAGEKAWGERPKMAPAFPEELESYQIGLVAFGGVLLLFLIGWLVMAVLEKED